MSVEALRLLDLEGSGRFSMSEAPLLDPRELPWQVVAESCEDDRTFVVVVAGSRPMALMDIAPLRDSWVRQHGLLQGDDLQRLIWIVNTFSKELEVDLQRVDGLSLKDLWQAREWRRLLNHIDHLPQATWSQAAMMNHPEHAARLAESLAAKRLKGEVPERPSPPLVSWTSELAALTDLTDAVNSVRHAVLVTGNHGSKKVKPPEPMPRPETAVARLIESKERVLRWRAHETLANRLLPGRRK